MLFLQATEAGGYPPVINAATIMAASGWHVLVLNAPISGHAIAFPRDCGVVLKNMPARRSHIMRKRDYMRYLLAAARLAASFRPNVVYASDPPGALPGLVASRISRAKLVYHEHDCPNPGTLNRRIAQFRCRAARRAQMVIFPNAARARIAQPELGFRDEQLRIVWNVPRQSELLSLSASRDPAVYYHGSITPERLPLCVIDAIAAAQHGLRLRIVGYEAPGAAGYVARCIEYGRRSGGNLVEYLGQAPRASLFAQAGRAMIGLALVPRDSADVNMKYMTGASNKAFDYMASGLALLVTDLPDWVGSFVQPGYGRACDPADVASITAQLNWLASNPAECRNMGERGRAKIEMDWNYDTLFNPVLMELGGMQKCVSSKATMSAGEPAEEIAS